MKIQFKWIGAGCFILQINDYKIACDPCLSRAGTRYNFGFFKSERLLDPVYRKDDFSDIDLWLITHNHEDHLDEEGLEMINTESIVLCHKNARKTLGSRNVKNIKTLKPGEEYTAGKNNFNIQISAIPARHGVVALSSFLAGGVNGYWLNASESGEMKSFYITGDTVWNAYMSSALGNRMCDVLVPNVGAARKEHYGGPLTLDNDMLIKMINKLEPLVVLPIHHGCFSHYSEGLEQLSAMHDPRNRLLERGKNFQFNI